MKNVLKNILESTGLVVKQSNERISTYTYARAYFDFKIIAKNYLKDILLIIIGIFSATFGFKGFLLQIILLMGVLQVFLCSFQI